MKYLEKFTDMLLSVLDIGLLGVICIAVVMLIEATTVGPKVANAVEISTVYSATYNTDVSDEAMNALYYSSKTGMQEGSMRNSTLDCYTYLGGNIKCLQRYTSAVGTISIVSPNDKDVYMIIDEANDSYLTATEVSYDEYRRSIIVNE